MPLRVWMAGRRGRVVAVFAAVCLLLSGCTASPAPAAGTPSAASAVQRRPLDAYQFTRDEQTVVLSALQILREQCMARYGFELREAKAPYRPADTIQPDRRQPDLFGVPGDGKDGYALGETSDSAAAVAAESANSQYLDSLPAASEAYGLALAGRYKRHTDQNIPETLPDQIGGVDVYPTGCDGWAWDQVAPGDVSEGVPAIIREIDPWDAAAADPRVLQSAQSWSACMEQSGYRYANPDAIQNEDRQRQMDQPSGVPNFDAIQKQEQFMRSIAPVDAACRTTSGYAQTRYDVLVEYDNTAIEAHATELAELRSTMDAEVRRAADIVKQAGW